MEENKKTLDKTFAGLVENIKEEKKKDYEATGSKPEEIEKKIAD
jgi:hypothetical protein